MTWDIEASMIIAVNETGRAVNCRGATSRAPGLGPRRKNSAQTGVSLTVQSKLSMILHVREIG